MYEAHSIDSTTCAIGSRLTDAKPLVGLLGVLVAALGADFNEFVSLLTLSDVRGLASVTIFSRVSRPIDVHVTDHPGLPFLGAGETAQGPTRAVLANAITDATGAR